MDNQIGIGISTKLDSFAAGKEAASSAFYHIGRQAPDVILIFISTIFSQRDAIIGVRSVIKHSPLIGCSSIGSITSSGFFRDSVAICAIKSDHLKFSFGIGKNISKNARLAGNDAARQSSDLKGGGYKAVIHDVF